jgi:hypothetical protein
MVPTHTHDWYAEPVPIGAYILEVDVQKLVGVRRNAELRGGQERRLQDCKLYRGQHIEIVDTTWIESREGEGVLMGLLQPDSRTSTVGAAGNMVDGVSMWVDVGVQPWCNHYVLGVLGVDNAVANPVRRGDYTCTEPAPWFDLLYGSLDQAASVDQMAITPLGAGEVMQFTELSYNHEQRVVIGRVAAGGAWPSGACPQDWPLDTSPQAAGYGVVLYCVGSTSMDLEGCRYMAPSEVVPDGWERQMDQDVPGVIKYLNLSTARFQRICPTAATDLLDRLTIQLLKRADLYRQMDEDLAKRRLLPVVVAHSYDDQGSDGTAVPSDSASPQQQLEVQSCVICMEEPKVMVCVPCALRPPLHVHRLQPRPHLANFLVVSWQVLPSMQEEGAAHHRSSVGLGTTAATTSGGAKSNGMRALRPPLHRFGETSA